MITTVTGKNQITIPAKLARALGIKPGSRLNWQQSDEKDILYIRILPDRRTMAMSLMGVGRKYLKEGEDPVTELVKAREIEERERLPSS